MGEHLVDDHALIGRRAGRAGIAQILAAGEPVVAVFQIGFSLDIGCRKRRQVFHLKRRSAAVGPIGPTGIARIAVLEIEQRCAVSAGKNNPFAAVVEASDIRADHVELIAVSEPKRLRDLRQDEVVAGPEKTFTRYEGDRHSGVLRVRGRRVAEDPIGRIVVIGVTRSLKVRIGSSAIGNRIAVPAEIRGIPRECADGDIKRRDVRGPISPDDKIGHIAQAVEDHQPALLARSPEDVVLSRVGTGKDLAGVDRRREGPKRSVDIVDVVVDGVVGYDKPAARVEGI